MLRRADTPAGPPFTIERVQHRPDGTVLALVRQRGGRHVQVMVPAARANGPDIADAIAVALQHLPAPPGPNTF